MSENVHPEQRADVTDHPGTPGRGAQPDAPGRGAQPGTPGRTKKKGLTTQDLILIAVLLAAGAVLKLTVASFLSFAGMKPNFVIAMYCLAIILTRPKVPQAFAIGLIAGIMCQIPMLNATPLVNIPSEAFGSLACGLLIHIPLKLAGKADANPLVSTFLSTVVSGYTFAIIVGLMNGLALPVIFVTYAVMVFGTGAFNAVLVQILTPLLRKVLKRTPENTIEHVRAHTPVREASGMIELRDFTFQYFEGDTPVVRDVSLSIPAGAFVGMTGAAGSGKSTLTYAMNGIIPHCYPGDFCGSVIVDGMDTRDASLTDLSRVVGSVCQDIDSQIVTSIVEDEMLYGLENFGVPHDEIEARVEEALADMGISDLRDRVIASLSGGQKQKVAIASVLAMKPKVLVLDEPTAELDPASSLQVFELLARYAREHGTTVVVVEQKIALLSEFADMLVIVDSGRIRFAGAPAEVLAHSEELLEIGVNCPRSTTLMNRLAARGVYSGSVCRNVGEACTALTSVFAVAGASVGTSAGTSAAAAGADMNAAAAGTAAASAGAANAITAAGAGTSAAAGADAATTVTSIATAGTGASDAPGSYTASSRAAAPRALFEEEVVA